MWLLWVLSNVAILALIGGFLVADRQTLHWYSAPPADPTATPRPEPDRVVGVTCRKEFPDSSAARLAQGRDCDDAASLARFRGGQVWLEVTVRTFSGGSYVVTVPPETKVKVGDRWPK